MWNSRRDLMKLVQATAVILRTETHAQMNYTKLLKLLYIADRESLKETERSITEDNPVAMDRGPVLSSTLNLINGCHAKAGTWERFIQRDIYNGYIVNLVADPGRGRLSRYEIAKLQEVAHRFAGQDEWDMIEHTHTFHEWQKNHVKGSSRPIPLHDVLEAMGVADREDAIVAADKTARAYDRFFERTAPKAVTTSPVQETAP